MLWVSETKSSMEFINNYQLLWQYLELNIKFVFCSLNIIFSGIRPKPTPVRLHGGIPRMPDKQTQSTQRQDG